MKRLYRHFFGTAFLLTCLLGACVSFLEAPGEKTGTTEGSETKKAAATATAKNSWTQSARPSAEEKPPPGRIEDLPAEAKDYLEILREAFRNKDIMFLASQGEAQYEKDLRPVMDEEAYLALLYRCGPYSDDKDWKSPTLVHLDIEAIRSIEYTGWKEDGPMLDITGRLNIRNSDPIPCRIVLIWRLKEPKILGAWP